MSQLNLFAVFLGGKITSESLIEDHNLVFVVASSEQEARTLAKKKWQAKDIHVDGTQKLNSVDGYQIILEKGAVETDDFQINPKYSA